MQMGVQPPGRLRAPRLQTSAVRTGQVSPPKTDGFSTISLSP
jgi:hypothetical protein